MITGSYNNFSDCYWFGGYSDISGSYPHSNVEQPIHLIPTSNQRLMQLCSWCGNMLVMDRKGRCESCGGPVWK